MNYSNDVKIDCISNFSRIKGMLGHLNNVTGVNTDRVAEELYKLWPEVMKQIDWSLSIQELKDKGYKFEITMNGYKLSKKDTLIVKRCIMINQPGIRRYRPSIQLARFLEEARLKAELHYRSGK